MEGKPAYGEVRGMLQGVKLTDLPASLSDKLKPFDVNGNGVIDPDELPLGDADHILIKAFPPDTQQVLNEIDDEKNGKLEMDELNDIFSTYAAMKKASKEGSIAIKSLPKEIQPTLKTFDVDGDGTVAPMELARGAELYRESKKKAKRLMIFSGVLVFVLCALVGVIVGLVAVVVEESKETKADSSGALVKKGTSTPVGTATATKTLGLFDMPGQSAGTLLGVKRISLKQLGTLLGYTITGYRATDTKVTFLASSGDVVTVDDTFINVSSASGKPIYSEQKSAKRRRGLLGDDPGQVVVEQNTMDDTDKAEANGVCFNLYHRFEETSGGLNPDSINPKDKANAENECVDKCASMEGQGCVGFTMAGDSSVCYFKSKYVTTGKEYKFAGEGSWTDYYFKMHKEKNGYEACMKEADAQTMQAACAEEKRDLAKAEERANAAEAAKETAEDKASAAEAAKKTAEDKASAAEAAKKTAEDKASAAEAAKKTAEDKASAAEAAKKTAEDKASAAEAAKKTAEEQLAAAKAPTSATLPQGKLTNGELRQRVREWMIGLSCPKHYPNYAYGNIGDWDVSLVTDMNNLFNIMKHSEDLLPDRFESIGLNLCAAGKETCIQNLCLQDGETVRIPDLSKWDVSKVTDFSYMFKDARFNDGDWMKAWDISNAGNLEGMFHFNRGFNQDISNWDVSKVTNMKEMFLGAASFNQDISKWDISKVVNTNGMFRGAVDNKCSVQASPKKITCSS